jgi:hypothetical protein
MKMKKSQKVESLLKVLRDNLLSWHRKLSKYDQDSELTLKDLIKEAQSCIS